MATLVDRINAETIARREEAATLYRKLLGRADDPRPGDFEAMRGVMATLGVDGTQMAADLKALAAARSLREQRASDDDLRRMHDEARRLEEAGCDELRQLMVRAIEGLDVRETLRAFATVNAFVGKPTDYPDTALKPARMARLEIEAAHNRNRDADRRLADLASAHPLAFGGQPGTNPPTPAPAVVPRPKPATRRLAYTVPVHAPAR